MNCRPSITSTTEAAVRRGRIRPRLGSVSAKCRLNVPLSLDRAGFRLSALVDKRAFHRHEAGGVLGVTHQNPTPDQS